jgi:predicted nucleic acid-binding protein
MPSPEKIVINTGPILALVAALGSLDLLSNLYKEVIVPHEVGQEIMAAGGSGFAIKEFTEAAWLRKREQPVWPHPFLSNSLDVGEASVIQLALDEQIGTVCIDEALGRRVARLNNLKLTGSVGILLRAKKEGHPVLLKESLLNMQSKGIWLGKRVVDFALKEAGEKTEL